MSCSIAVTISVYLCPETNISPATACGNVIGRTMTTKMKMTKTLSVAAAAASTLPAIGQRSPVTDSLFRTGQQRMLSTQYHSAWATGKYTQPEGQRNTDTASPSPNLHKIT